MKEQKDIFDLIRENEYKLEEQPSKRAWQRLERRLEVQHKPQGLTLYRQLGMVAAMLVFVLVCSVLLFIPKQTEPLQLALNEVEAVPLADLVYKDVDQEALKVVEFTRHLPYRSSRPIAEGNLEQKLRHSAGKNTASNLSANEGRLSTKFRTPSTGTLLADTIIASFDLNKTDAYPPVLSLFNWLVGDWKSEQGAKVSKESWVARDSQTLNGQGFLVKGKDTLFSEFMSIRNIGSEVFLTTSLEVSQNPIQYELVALDSNKAIFENEKVAFPQQVILQQKDRRNFTTIYQNSQPVNMSKAQMEYMKARNALYNEQAVRKLEKIK